MSSGYVEGFEEDLLAVLGVSAVVLVDLAYTHQLSEVHLLEVPEVELVVLVVFLVFLYHLLAGVGQVLEVRVVCQLLEDFFEAAGFVFCDFLQV